MAPQTGSAHKPAPTQALPGEDGSANTSVPTQALPGNISFYIVRDATSDGFDGCHGVISEDTTLGDVLSVLLEPPGDGFLWGAFLTHPITENTIGDTRIEESFFYGRYEPSNHAWINMRTLLWPLVQRYSRYVVVYADASTVEIFQPIAKIHTLGG